jgi:hypothetical protein
MKILLIPAILFISGSLLIIKDYNDIGPYTSWLTWTGGTLCFIGVILFFPLTTWISKKKSNGK